MSCSTAYIWEEKYQSAYYEHVLQIESRIFFPSPEAC